jgi:hypothetical protein
MKISKWTSCKKSLKIPKGQPETIYRRSIDMNINAYFHFVHTDCHDITGILLKVAWNAIIAL